MSTSTSQTECKDHHTVTNIVFDSCSKVLGADVKKIDTKETVKGGYLDLSYHGEISRDTLIQIENDTNRQILKGERTTGKHEHKTDSESDNHSISTSEVGLLKITQAEKTNEGNIRLQYVIGEQTIQTLNTETNILTGLGELWSIPYSDIVSTAKRMFKDYKSLNDTTKKRQQQILRLQIKWLLNNPQCDKCIFRSDEADLTSCSSFIVNSAADLKEKKKSLVFVGKSFIYGILVDSSLLNVDKLKTLLKEGNGQSDVETVNKIEYQDSNTNKTVQVDDVVQFSYSGVLDDENVVKFFTETGFTLSEI